MGHHLELDQLDVILIRILRQGVFYQFVVRKILYR
jgi:hypothetical protein